MPARKIEYDDVLREGTDKLNDAIEIANIAESDSKRAIFLANTADSTSKRASDKADRVEKELGEAILGGDSGPLGGVLRVGYDGTGYDAPQERFVKETESFNKQVTEVNNKISLLAQNSLSKISQDMAAGLAVNVEAYGDSTYYGLVSGGSGQVSQPPPQVLQTILRSYFDNESIRVLNKGVSGNQTTNALRTFAQDMVNSNAALIYINYALNDLSGANPSEVNDPAISAEQYRLNLRRMVELARANNKVVIMETPNVQNANHTANNFLFRMEGTQQFADAVRQVGKEMNVPIVDQQYLTKKFMESRPNVVSAYPDGIHPSQLLYKQKGVNMAIPLLHPIPVKGSVYIPAGTPGVRGASPGRNTDGNIGSKSNLFFFSDTSIKIPIWIDEPGLDVYIATPQYANGSNSCTIRVDGDPVGVLNMRDPDFASTFGVDSEVMVIEDAAPGVHLIEMNNTGEGRVGFYYVRTHKTRKANLGFNSNTPGFQPIAIQRTTVLSDLEVDIAESGRIGHVMIDVPTSRLLKTLDIEMVATLQKGDGIMLFTKPVSDNTGSKGGLYAWLDNVGGFWKCSEGAGKTGFTSVTNFDNVDRSGVSNRYRITVTPSGRVTYFINGQQIATYQMTKAHFGGFLGIYKNSAGRIWIDKISIN